MNIYNPVSLSNTPLAFSSIHLSEPNSIEFEKISVTPNLEEKIDETHLSSNEIQKIISPILKEFLSKMHYNQLNLICQYIDYYNKTNSHSSHPITPLQALESFIPDLQANLEATNGGNCYEFIENIKEKLPSSLNCNLIPSSVPTEYIEQYYHKLSHIVALIAYNNPKDSPNKGFILLDPSFELNEPIKIPFHGTSKEVTSLGGKTFIFSHEGDTILGKIRSYDKSDDEHESEKELQIIYFLKKITNFVDVAVKPFIAATRKILLLTYGDCLENNSSFCIRLNKEIITWRVGFERKPSITFNDFLSKKFQFNQSFSNSSFLDINKVNSSIEKILLHKELLETLYLTYIDALKKDSYNQDFLMDK